MSAVRIPTPEQNDAIVHSNRSRYARQYRDNQDEAIAEMQAARIRYELARAERAEQEVRAAAGVACCAIPTPGEDGEPQVMAWVGSTPVLIIVALACVAWVAYFWSAV